MADLRRAPPAAVTGIPIAYTDDYATGIGIDHATGAPYPLALERANVLHDRFADGGFVMVRPRGRSRSCNRKGALAASRCGQGAFVLSIRGARRS